MSQENETSALLQERKSVHGDWDKQSHIAFKLKKVLRSGVSFELELLTPSQQEAIEMICVKISRIACGDPNHADHWDDILGYAQLGKKGHEHDDSI